MEDSYRTSQGGDGAGWSPRYMLMPTDVMGKGVRACPGGLS